MELEFGMINLRIQEHHKSHTREHLMSARDNQMDLLKCMLCYLLALLFTQQQHKT